MDGMLDGIQSALRYIEENLAEELDIGKIAARSHFSAFHFQRMFGALCGVTVGEYIRSRRMTLAAAELSREEARVIDVAVKYGYDSPDSFSRAFARFHGVSPSAARKKGARLKAYAPLHIKITWEGGKMMEYSITEKPAFTVMGRLRRISAGGSYDEIPRFWQEHMNSDGSRIVCGMYGVCMGMTEGGTEFEYLIADNYIPWNEIPDGYEARTIPASAWAVFPCRGALPKALQDVNTRIWNEWLPSCREYKLGGNYNIEMYAPPAEKPEDTYCEIWVPVERA